ncbi:uncharacterized protein LOC135500237 [Lineus longissimus]|uniref:uncharacterized protein LOC135500237 n=1 Tax=Lineus longissimus TaxID=88925 RepID=UPI002B4C7DCF
MINRRRSLTAKASFKTRSLRARCTERLDCCVIMVSASVLSLCVVLLIVAGSYAGPLHASCKVKWTFNQACEDVQKTVVSQINKMQGPDGCEGGGEKCRYKLVSNEGNVVKATHTTPVKEYVDDLSFTFAGQDKTCSCDGYSTSETWYAVLDYGTNYCNLNNLITGAGLNKTAGYKEETSDSICTQYSSHDCDKY